MEALVCVVLVNYNGYQDTAECIRSLLKCRYKNIKIIVVDNASAKVPDKTDMEYILGNARFIRSGKNIGFAGANNLGVRHAKEYGPKYILILNNDTVVKKDFLNILIDTCEKEKQVGIATCKICYYDEPDTLWFGGSYYDSKSCEMKIEGIGEKDGPKYSVRKNLSFSTACLWLIPLETFEKIGEMNEDYFLYYEDADYCERIINGGYRILYIPEAVIYHKESRSTKKGSFLYHYYNTRNYLYYLTRYRGRKKRYRAMFRRLYMDMKSVIRGRIPIKAEIMAWRDFVLGHKGSYGHWRKVS